MKFRDEEETFLYTEIIFTEVTRQYGTFIIFLIIKVQHAAVVYLRVSFIEIFSKK